MVNNVTRLDAVFSALSDPTRRRILERLARGPLTVGEIAGGFPISAPAISKHVRILEDAHLIARAVAGRTHTCTLRPNALRAAETWIDRQRRFWNAALDNLEEFLETTK